MGADTTGAAARSGALADAEALLDLDEDEDDAGAPAHGPAPRASIVLLVLREALGAEPRRAAQLVALSLLGVGARIGTFAVVLLYVKAQVGGKAIRLAGVALPGGDSIGAILGWGGAALLCGVAAALAFYVADHLSFTVAWQHCQRIADRLRSDPRGGPEAAARFLAGSAPKIARALVLGLSGITPALMLAASVVVVCVANGVLAITLAPLLALYLALFVRLDRRVVEAVRERESGDPVRALRHILLARRRVDNLRDGFQALALLVLLAAFGLWVRHEPSSWTALVTVVVALRYAAKSLGDVSKRWTGMQRQLARFAPGVVTAGAAQS
jgi:hypothetical protein